MISSLQKFLILGAFFLSVTLGFAAEGDLTREGSDEHPQWAAALTSSKALLKTTISYKNQAYSAILLNAAPENAIRSFSAQCDASNGGCVAVANRICFIKRDNVTFNTESLSKQAQVCEENGGLAAVFYQASIGLFSGSFKTPSLSIPVLSVSHQSAIRLLASQDVALEISNIVSNERTYEAFCGASLIDSRWLLTAAHCLDGVDPNDIDIVIGVKDLLTFNQQDEHSEVFGIREVFVHPNWNSNTLENDIALIELDATSQMQPVSLLAKNDVYLEPLEDVEMLGWSKGEHDLSGGLLNMYAQKARRLSFSLVSQVQCGFELNQVWQSLGVESPNIKLSDAVLCGKPIKEATNSCDGDSGGPLFVQRNNITVQLGIVSWGFGCQQSQFHSVFTNIVSYTDWIEKIIHSLSVESRFDFGLIAEDFSNKKRFRLVNRSLSSMLLSYEFSGVTAQDFQLGEHNCNKILEPNKECYISVYYKPSLFDKSEAELLIDDQWSNFNTQVMLRGTLLKRLQNRTLESSVEQKVEWFSGGESHWTFHDQELQSGSLGDAESSYLLASVSGQGVFSFEWAVSSESKDYWPKDPKACTEYERCDALYLYKDNELLNVIDGQKSFSKLNIRFEDDGPHHVLFAYQKDNETSVARDKGFVRNVSFSSLDSVNDNNDKNNRANSSGGSMGWFLIGLFVFGFRKKITVKVRTSLIESHH